MRGKVCGALPSPAHRVAHPPRLFGFCSETVEPLSCDGDGREAGCRMTIEEKEK